MDRPGSSPAYLAHCNEALLDSMAEAQALVLAGENGDQLAETVRFASDLLDVIAEGLNELTSDPDTLVAFKHLRDQVIALRGHLMLPGHLDK